MRPGTWSSRYRKDVGRMLQEGKRYLHMLYSGELQRHLPVHVSGIYAGQYSVAVHGVYRDSTVVHSCSRGQCECSSCSTVGANRNKRRSSVLGKVVACRTPCRLRASPVRMTKAVAQAETMKKTEGRSPAPFSPCASFPERMASKANQDPASAATNAIGKLRLAFYHLATFGRTLATTSLADEKSKTSCLEGDVFAIRAWTYVQRSQKQQQQQLLHQWLHRQHLHMPLQNELCMKNSELNSLTRTTTVKSTRSSNNGSTTSTSSGGSSYRVQLGVYRSLGGLEVSEAVRISSPEKALKTHRLRQKGTCHGTLQRSEPSVAASTAASLGQFSNAAPTVEGWADLKGTVMPPRDIRRKSEAGTSVSPASAAVPFRSLSLLARSGALLAGLATTSAATTAVESASEAAAPVADTVARTAEHLVVSACSTCSLSSASAWKKWLQILSEADPQRRKELLLEYPPLCRKHDKMVEASSKKVCVVSFRQLLRLLEAAALHPHATQDAITVLRQHVRLGMTNNTTAAAAGEHTGAETAEPSPVSGQSTLLPSLASVANAEAAQCLAYVESGLTTLALEKGAQLLQSFRDFDCTESFLLEAVAAGAAPRVGSAAPRWCFRVLDGPLHPPPNRQKNTWQQLESGSLLILKPVDSAAAFVAKELRLLHGRSFDFASVTVHAAAAASEVLQSTFHPGSGLPVHQGHEGDLRITEERQQLLQALLEATGEKHNVRCVFCGLTFLVSVEKLLQRSLDCPNCSAGATSMLAAPNWKAEIRSEMEITARAADYPSSLIQGHRQSERFKYRDLREVLQQLDMATCWASDRYALEAPAFIASVCSNSRRQALKVKVHPCVSLAGEMFQKRGGGNEAESAVAGAAQKAEQQQQYLQHESQHDGKAGFSLPEGARFWAMPVSFIAAVHTRQVETLEGLAGAASMQLLSAQGAAETKKGAAAPSETAPFSGSHVLRVLTANKGSNKSSKSIQKAASLAAVVEDELAVSTCSTQGLHSTVSPARKGTEAPDAATNGTVQDKEAHRSLLGLSKSLTFRQREAVFAAISRENRIVTIEGPPGTGKTAVAGAIVREWVSGSPIFVAAGTHAALRSLKNKLDEEGVRTVRLSDEVSVVAALETPSATQKALVLLDTVYQGHRLAKLNLRPRRVLVDESSQLTEFAGLGALVNGTDLVVLIGDERQLPPASALPPSSSPRSLFSALKGGACRSVLLNLQFRMPPLLAAFISAHFYEGMLLTHPGRLGSTLLPHKPPNRPENEQKQEGQRAAADSTSLSGFSDGPLAPPDATKVESRNFYDVIGLAQCEVFAGSNPANDTQFLKVDNSNHEHNFPWPDGSEGDKDLAKKLLEQMDTEFLSSGPAGPATCWSQNPPYHAIPEVLPVLFVDTSLWASGPTGMLATIELPVLTTELAAAALSSTAATSPGSPTEGCRPLMKSLPAEQRVKGSLQNPLEAFLVYRCVETLLSCGASKAEIAVLTPYQAQAQLLSRILHPAEQLDGAQKPSRRSGRLCFVQPALDVLDERCRPHPQVFTVDGFQGHERKYVILSAVKGFRRSDHEFFLFDPRRINVALSRASGGLIIIGNAQALVDASPTWRSFLLFLRMLGAVLPLDHPSLRRRITEGMLLPRCRTPQHVSLNPRHTFKSGKNTSLFFQKGHRNTESSPC